MSNASFVLVIKKACSDLTTRCRFSLSLSLSIHASPTMEFVFSINDIKSWLGALDILIKGLG